MNEATGLIVAGLILAVVLALYVGRWSRSGDVENACLDFDRHKRAIDSLVRIEAEKRVRVEGELQKARAELAEYNRRPLTDLSRALAEQASDRANVISQFAERIVPTLVMPPAPGDRCSECCMPMMVGQSVQRVQSPYGSSWKHADATACQQSARAYARTEPQKKNR